MHGSCQATLCCCAGYSVKCPFLPADISVLKGGKPELMHLVVHPKLPGVYFLGFVQAHGPMIPCVESQVPYVADLIQARPPNSSQNPSSHWPDLHLTFPS